LACQTLNLVVELKEKEKKEGKNRTIYSTVLQSMKLAGFRNFSIF